MNSLPPTFPSTNKVKSRSKTTSFKRPMSCDVNEMVKKESKGLFFTLRKGSSNSKLNEEVDHEDIVKPNIARNNKIDGRMQGRHFDSDDDDYDLRSEETSVTKMDKLFEDYDKVINNPALLGYLLQYLSSHNLDFYGLLCYLVIQHYKTTVQLKEFKDEAPRFANEIITTFIHDKSNLKIDHHFDTTTILTDLQTKNNLLNIFDKSAEEIYKYIKSSIDKIRGSIKHGLSSLDVSVASFNFDSKMNFFNDCIRTIVTDLENKLPRESNSTITKEIKEKEQYLSEIITGVKTSLATIYYYFTKKEKDEGSDSVSMISNKHVRNSLLMRSTESLQVMTNCVLDKQIIFCSKLHKKPTTYSIFKKGKSYKGHNFLEKVFEYPEECLFCAKLLCGINPQGLYCSSCLEAVHRTCKDHVRTICVKDSKRPQRNISNTKMPIEDEQNRIGVPDDDAISINSQLSINSNVNEKDSQDVIEKRLTSFSSEMSKGGKPNYVISTATICVTNDDNSSNLDSELMDINNDRQHDNFNSDNHFKQDIQHDDKGHVKKIANTYNQKNVSRSQSDDNIENRYFARSTISVQDLITESTAWANDQDMEVEETFDANKELESFADHVTKKDDKAEYTRLLVLMEFHHKIRFTIMTLKRFDYLLIRQWPDESLLFKTLSLNVIIPLYELIKTLEITIRQCKTDISYSDSLAQNVYNWLVLDNESNLQKWLCYSIDLCCTNSLNVVKNSWKDCRTDSNFSAVLTKRHNKMLMVDQLSNMRPLLFNLPLIVFKISKDLSKFKKFEVEAKQWREISEKFKTLPTYIDERCMPLVQLINSGIILNSLDRGNWTSRLKTTEPFFEYMVDFPKTAFHHKLFDFQEIKISNFRDGTNKSHPPVVVIKEIIDAYAICYDDMLVFLQKENDKFLLKQFKAVDVNKINPILMLDNVYASVVTAKDHCELNLVFINVAVLAQIWLKNEPICVRWKEFISPPKSYTLKSKSKLEAETEFKTEIETEIVFETKTSVDKYADIKAKLVDFSYDHSTFFKEYIKPDDINEMDDVSFPMPTDSKTCLVETSFDAINILKTCYDNLSVHLNDEVLDDLFSKLSRMKTRIANCIIGSSKDILSTDDIEFEISDIQRDDVEPSMTPQNTPIESGCDSVNIKSEDDLGSASYLSGDNHAEISDDEIFNEYENMSINGSTLTRDFNQEGLSNWSKYNETAEDIEHEHFNEKYRCELTNDEDLLLFVDEYINKVISDAQNELSIESSSNIESNNYPLDDVSSLQTSSTISNTLQ